MNTTLTDTAADLYATILLQPEDDTLRTMFADALDDAGDHDRAEFIRVQMELASLEGVKCNDPEGCYYANKCDHGCGMNKLSGLRSRASELLAQHGDGWRRGSRCEACEGSGAHRYYPDIHGRPNYSGSAPCSTCHGTGYTSPLSEQITHGKGRLHWRHKVEWSRGLVASYSATHAEVFDNDGPSEWACDVARAFPVQRIVIPYEAWELNEMLPGEVVDEMMLLAPKPPQDEKAGRDLLARAIANVVRRAAFADKSSTMAMPGRATNTTPGI